MREDVVPIRVLSADAHVIGNDVDDESHRSRVQILGQGAQVGFGTELRVDACRIDDVVAVHTSLSGGDDGRTIEMRHAEPRQVVDLRPRVGKGERMVHLHAVCRGKPRMERGHHGD